MKAARTALILAGLAEATAMVTTQISGKTIKYQPGSIPEAGGESRRGLAYGSGLWQSMAVAVFTDALFSLCCL